MLKKFSFLFFLLTFFFLFISSGCGETEESKQEAKSPREEILKNRQSPIIKDRLTEKVKELGIPVPVGVQIDSNCDIEDVLGDKEITLSASSDDFTFVIAKMPLEETEAIIENKCVLKLVKPQEFKSMLAGLQVDFANDRIKKFANSNIGKAIVAKDITNRTEITKMLEEKMKERKLSGEEIDVISPYQLYVTPNDKEVQNSVKNLNNYQAVLDFTLQELAWIADSEFTPYLEKAGVEVQSEDENWLTPAELLIITKDVDPVKSVLKSDCSEQANYLVSALIAKGYDPEKVRVILAQVDFGGGDIGGHAFAQYYDEQYQVWVPLDPTMGISIEEGELLEGIDSIAMDYFLTHDYGVKEMWYAYNNQYFLNFEDQKDSNAPNSWLNPNASLETVLEQGLEE